ncbi:rhodanese-related sulfurtransferase [Fluoribacter dumoffii]|uniref:tRNA uridine(34) hydroxylase n=1 Tax=Fluoribacter dumoffii TaxID=463 RepID=A0A377G6X2_9GAMM|nr:rhodanese-related sulfurtransferase [Fluoribacter dumoffii]KTC91631.1 sulfur transferase [Fluoribacter dumoffii NY 23]MCW8387245.1 rhodanese-related sulfurtransferase [Fluoribacter dumoffii]MCW8417249.1 rhodanese-related sulfurtransferase [Fluoribacter dumoffii]MCW8454910.1 rhodanese-related sulfurtransferase [Fluoribacter dumoffii]MCW8461013.1 rhodanese-related sulfurtransferase [Fluoribacter dumoffii]
MKKIVIASFYKFVSLEDFEAMREPLLAKMHEIGIKGTIILAAEGINGSFAGSREQMDQFYEFIHGDERLADLRFKETFDDENPFEKSKVKLRKEIVTMGIKNIDPLKKAGTYLTPEEWNQLIQDPDVVLIDTRNDYEFELGTFKNAVNPSTENFRDFPEYVREHLLDKKDKKIAMFCTGGIRCEKSTAYLKDLGFENVFHLHDGILNYIEKMPKEKSLWEGQCFVFDNRVAVDDQLNRVYPQLPLDYKHDRVKE